MYGTVFVYRHTLSMRRGQSTWVSFLMKKLIELNESFTPVWSWEYWASSTLVTWRACCPVLRSFLAAHHSCAVETNRFMWRQTGFPSWVLDCSSSFLREHWCLKSLLIQIFNNFRLCQKSILICRCKEHAENCRSLSSGQYGQKICITKFKTGG